MPSVPGYKQGQYYPAGSLYDQGLSFGTPRDWTGGRGGQQVYDERYVTPLYRESSMPTSRPRPLPGAKPSSGGGVIGGGNRTPFGAALPWQGGSDLFAPTNPFAGITTSIVPRAIYSPEQTLAATNQAVAENQAAGNINDILKRFDSPGISRGAAHVARALPIAAQANQAARRVRAQLPMEDFFANQQAILGGETARENEAQSLAQLALRQRANEQQLRQGLAGQQLQNFGAGFNLVDALMGL